MERTGGGGLGGAVWERSCRREMRQVEAAGRTAREGHLGAGGESPSEVVLCRDRAHGTSVTKPQPGM